MRHGHVDGERRRDEACARQIAAKGKRESHAERRSREDEEEEEDREEGVRKESEEQIEVDRKENRTRTGAASR